MWWGRHNNCTWESEVGGSLWAQGQPHLYSESSKPVWAIEWDSPNNNNKIWEKSAQYSPSFLRLPLPSWSFHLFWPVSCQHGSLKPWNPEDHDNCSPRLLRQERKSPGQEVSRTGLRIPCHLCSPVESWTRYVISSYSVMKRASQFSQRVPSSSDIMWLECSCAQWHEPCRNGVISSFGKSSLSVQASKTKTISNVCT